MARGRKAAVVETRPVEGPRELPEGWRWETAGVALPLSYGKALSAKLRSSTGSVPVFGSSGEVGVHDQALIDGPSLIVGRKGSAGAVHFSPGPSWPIDTAYFTRGSGLVDIRYGFHLLKWLRLDRLDQSTAIPSLSRDNYDPIPIPLPPLDTQRRIVARIDELFTELDDGETALARARADLETYRKSLLKAAVTGELTADWRAANPPAETGEQLLQRILADRKARWEADPKNKGKRYKSGSMEEIAPDHQRRMWQLPDSWQWLQIGEFAFVTKLAGFEYTKYVRYADDGDLRVIKAENAGPKGFRETNFSRVHSASVEQLTRSKLRTGDLLMVFVGAGTGNVATVPEGDDFFLGPNIGMIRIETGQVIPLYLEHYLRSPQGKDMALALSKAVAQPSLSMGTIRQIPVPIPSVEEQALIVARLEEDLSAAEEAAAEAGRQTAQAQSLKQSILAAAFRGELVQ